MTLDPAYWPACWMYCVRGDVAVQGDSMQETRFELGERTTINRQGVLTYHCPCGSTLTRLPGDRIAEARDWVRAHTPHLSDGQSLVHKEIP